MSNWRGILVVTAGAAEFARVSPATIRKWAQRGKIERKGTSATGQALYDLEEIEREMQGFPDPFLRLPECRD